MMTKFKFSLGVLLTENEFYKQKRNLFLLETCFVSSPTYQFYFQPIEAFLYVNDICEIYNYLFNTVKIIFV